MRFCFYVVIFICFINFIADITSHDFLFVLFFIAMVFILDPFFGSGSLYFACRNTGRKCIGIEQSQRHIDCFFQRLEKQ